MTELTVCTFSYRGTRSVYSAWTANNLMRMVRANLTIPHRFVCITDEPDDPDFECETYPIWQGPPLAARSVNCFVRLKLAAAEMREVFGSRVLWLDQDIVIRGNFDDLITDDPFRCLRFRGKDFLSAGMVLVRPGEVDPDPWAACFDAKIVAASKRFPGSDQAILSALFLERVRRREIPAFTHSHGIVLNDISGNWRIMFRTGGQKPWMPRAPERELYLAACNAPPSPFDIEHAEACRKLRDIARRIEYRAPLTLHEKRAVRRIRQAVQELEQTVAAPR